MLVENPTKPDFSGYPTSEKINNYKLEAITDFGKGALIFASDNDGENNMVGATYK